MSKTITVNVKNEKYKEFVNGFLDSSNWILNLCGNVLLTDYQEFSLNDEIYSYIIALTEWKPATYNISNGKYSYSYLNNKNFTVDIYCNNKTTLYKYNLENTLIEDGEHKEGIYTCKEYHQIKNDLPKSKSISSHCDETLNLNDCEFGKYVGTIIADAINVDDYLKEHNQETCTGYVKGETNIEFTKR